jgi:predicted  nucleic acid-binding Zn-ribbon protein
MTLHPTRFALAFVGALAATGCSPLYYSTMETFGIEKRDILIDRVEDARDEQQEAKEQFQTTLERFKSVTQFDGGDIEDIYESLNSEYEECVSRVEAVRSRIESIEDVSDALFVEWEAEIDEIGKAEYRARSEQMLRDTKKRYAELHSAMVAAEQRMVPVLAAFNDQVLFLKHNLNAAAIASLEGDALEIEDDVARLIVDMEAAIAKADAFLAGMEAQS